MKKTVLAAAIIFSIASCGTKLGKQREVEGITKNQYQTQTGECFPKRYELCDSNHNYFTIKRDSVSIKLNIPVTSNDFKSAEVHNISSDTINAVLVHLKGGTNCTPLEPLTGFIKVDTTIFMPKVVSARMQRQDKLLVYIYNNQNGLGRTDIYGIKDYELALKKIRKESFCPTGVSSDNDKQPKEQDGDVIGGNQKR